MEPIKVICVAGARPNFMKVAPLFRALRDDPQFHPVLVHTGQHYDDSMSGQFFRDLGMPEADYSLQVGSGSHAVQTAEIMKRFEPVMEKERPGAVVVVGDVNSTAACALVTKKLSGLLVHVEAGLRSFDRLMPEEINRLVTDSITDLFFVTEESGRANLLREGVDPSRIKLVGNLMIDSLHYSIAKAKEAGVAERLGVTGKRYGVLTLHRPSNVDSPEALAEVMGAVSEISRELPLFFPVHPRTRARLDGIGADLSSVTLLDPLGAIEFAGLVAGSAVALTDSGGVQEETTALGIPCLTLRENTERPVTVELGTNLLAGVTRDSILTAWRHSLANPRVGRTPPLWDGNAADRCRRELLRAITRDEDAK
jgi:UDP-N-acetylglucosamine 2-epimerase (non-hydrolysing)